MSVAAAFELQDRDGRKSLVLHGDWSTMRPSFPLAPEIAIDVI